MSTITYSEAATIIDAAFANARMREARPLAIAVLDSGGHVVLCARQDGASSLRVPIAAGKAAGALGLRMSSRRIAEIALERPAFIASLGSMHLQGLVPAAGGCLVFSEGGELVGAVGASGDTPDVDEDCVIAAIHAAGLKADDNLATTQQVPTSLS
ncbi:uncharacterized protein GlcG (DUF336 family) [Sphingomonas sp. UYAg733]